MKKVLSARGQVGYNKKHNFELWYNAGIYLTDRQKSRCGPLPIRGPAIEKHWLKLHFLPAHISNKLQRKIGTVKIFRMIKGRATNNTLEATETRCGIGL